MKVYELKGKLIGKAYSLIDLYFNGTSIVDILANSTAKAYIVSNEDAINGMLSTFADKDGEIDAEKILGIYMENIPKEGVNIDIREFVHNEYITSLMPDRLLHITRDDIGELFGNGRKDEVICET